MTEEDKVFKTKDAYVSELIYGLYFSIEFSVASAAAARIAQAAAGHGHMT